MTKYILPVLIAISALSVSMTAAFYSITGLSKLFAGAATSVMVMATVLEVSKLVTATLLHNYWNKLRLPLKVYLTTATVVLVLITSLGIYGFLTAAYQQTSSQASLIDNEVSLLETNKNFLESQIEELVEERSQISNTLSELRSGLSQNKIQYTDAQGNLITTTSSATRVALEKQIDQGLSRQTYLTQQLDSLNRVVFQLNVDITTVKNSAESATELGPLKYVAAIIDMEVDRVVNYLVLIIIFVFDPLAISLVLAANFAFSTIKPKEQQQLISLDQPLDPEFQATLDEMLIDQTPIKETFTTEKPVVEPQKDSQVVGISRNSPGGVSRKKNKSEPVNKIIY